MGLIRWWLLALVVPIVASCGDTDGSASDAESRDAGEQSRPSSSGTGGSQAARGDSGSRRNTNDAGPGAGGTPSGHDGSGGVDAPPPEGGAPEPLAGASGAASPRDDDGGTDPHDDDAGQSKPDEPVDPCAAPPLAADDGEIVLWLDAAAGVVADQEGRVERWVDQSEYQHVAEAVGEPGDWPLYLPQAAQGRPAVQFGVVGAGPAIRRLLIDDHSSLWFGMGEFSIIAVLRYRNTTDSPNPDMQFGAIFQKACDCPGFVGVLLFANDVWDPYAGTGPARTSFLFELAARIDYAARSLITGFNDNQVHVVVARRSHDELGVDVDDLPHATALVASTLDVSNPGVPVAIGAHGRVDLQALEGDIFELVAVRGTTAVQGITDCFMAKYGLR